jgi:Mg2+-importing ATPase
MALAVGLTPELLPMIMTVSLARGAQRMASAKVVVKRLSAIHDLGEMDAVHRQDRHRHRSADHAGRTSRHRWRGRRSRRRTGCDQCAVRDGLKSPLDEALITHMTRRPIDAWTKLDERPFDFERRRVSVLAEREGERIEIVKGAPETMLALCRQARDRSGALVAIDEAQRAPDSTP